MIDGVPDLNAWHTIEDKQEAKDTDVQSVIIAVIRSIAHSWT